jgi:hypothetical protein
MDGADGASGATGATGPGEASASEQGWTRLVLGSDISVNDVIPACSVTRVGDITLRGHVTLSPVPAIGGMLIGILPRDSFTGQCPCSVEEGGLDIIGTTTGLAFSNSTGNSLLPDVCIVRLLVTRVLRYDVTRDFVIDADDVRAVRNDPAYISNPNAASNCSTVTGCGNADVNLDGKVNQFDATAITEAVSSTRFPMDVFCGGVTSTAFSCGSTRSSPLVPAVGISLDTIIYQNDDGTLVSKKRSTGGVDAEALESLMTRSEKLVTRDALQSVAVEVDMLEEQITNLVPRQEFEDQLNESREERKTEESRHLFVDVFIAIAAVAAVAVASLVVKRRRA